MKKKRDPVVIGSDFKKLVEGGSSLEVILQYYKEVDRIFASLMIIVDTVG